MVQAKIRAQEENENKSKLAKPKTQKWLSRRKIGRQNKEKKKQGDLGKNRAREKEIPKKR